MSSLRAAAFWCLLATVAVCDPAAHAAESKGPYVLAVIPAAPPIVTHTLWAPFVERLGRTTGIDFRLKVYEKMSDFEKDITSGTPDLLFANPLQAVVAHEAQGYLPLVRGRKPVSAELFVRKDSAIRTVDDLSGKQIALVGSKNL